MAWVRLGGCFCADDEHDDRDHDDQDDEFLQRHKHSPPFGK